MATELSSFAELKKAPVAGVPQAPAAVREKEVDGQGRAYATGRRKNAVARVWVKLGTGKITVNGRDQKIYFARPTQQMVIQQPFDVSQRNGQFDVIATVSGGGLSGQAGAVRHGIAQALSKFEPALRGDRPGIRIGENSNLQDGTVVHVAARGLMTVVGDRKSVV